MRKVTLFFIFSLSMALVYAQSVQSIEFRMDSLGPSINGDTLFVYGIPSDSELNEELWVTQNTSSSIDISAKVYEEFIGAPIRHYICWDQCFPPANSGVNNPFISGSVAVGANTVVDDFSAHYIPDGRSACSMFRYVLFDLNNQSDSSFVFIKFCTNTVAIDEIKSQTVQLNAFPNPASSDLKINYDIGTAFHSASLDFYDVLGQKLVSRKLLNSKGKVVLNVASFNAGIYFYMVKVDGQTLKTERLVVQ
jgi:hypothetical protein